MFELSKTFFVVVLIVVMVVFSSDGASILKIHLESKNYQEHNIASAFSSGFVPTLKRTFEDLMREVCSACV